VNEIGAKVNFWRAEARQALQVAEDLFRLGHYLEALFFGHLALEKLLKAKIVRAIKRDPLYSHDLIILAKYAKLKLNEEDSDFLARVNIYNIRARYQDYKKSLYKRANKQFTKEELRKIGLFFNKIK
jgi:HEPN domain-containing protein